MLMMKSAAQDVREKHIRVNAIAPGAIRTSINRADWDTQSRKASFCGSFIWTHWRAGGCRRSRRVAGV